ncbi:uncharacterized protein EKO05_0007724 [Ascochyta rabiei]|uniref:uncharacterized protein n=1 Tax=Didymella rabiei TaxID=5454 RepID=UPI00220EBA66|nr:uncharacterized protein EKO05_0007724 [Ascochyta rabiei]UPX17362.1 hypothetical protein EKO05_0007724 [Ascochyta rabiei]
MSRATVLRPPPLPREGRDGKPFECSLCRYFTVVTSLSLVWILPGSNMSIVTCNHTYAPSRVVPLMIEHTSQGENGSVTNNRSIKTSETNQRW